MYYLQSELEFYLKLSGLKKQFLIMLWFRNRQYQAMQSADFHHPLRLVQVLLYYLEYGGTFHALYSLGRCWNHRSQ